MGVRVNFPNLPVSSYATLKPPLPFNFYQFNSNEDAPALGLLTNVGVVRSVVSRVAGRNYPYSYFLNLGKNNGEKLFFSMGNLLFLGWKELRWDNPYYIEDLRDRDFVVSPLYPRVIPSVRLNSIQFYRNGNSPTAGDFVSYVEWVDLIFDKAFSDTELDELKAQDDYVDDDAIWNIYSGELARAETLLFQERVKNFEYLEKLEREKMNLPTGNTSAGE